MTPSRLYSGSPQSSSRPLPLQTRAAGATARSDGASEGRTSGAPRPISGMGTWVTKAQGSADRIRTPPFVRSTVSVKIPAPPQHVHEFTPPYVGHETVQLGDLPAGASLG
jgi:hypothetical protein